MSRACILCLLLAAFTLSCGDDGGGEQTPVVMDEPLTISAYCQVYYEAFCERQVGCNVALLNQATSVQECLDIQLAACEPELNVAWLPSIEAGRAIFDGEALKTCRDTMPDASCKELAAGKLPDTCDAVLRGTIADGEPCYTAIECSVTGSACANLGRCPSVCEPPADPPAPFDCSLIPCPDGEYCNGNRCEAKLAQNDPCREVDSCQEGLFCGKDVDKPDLRCRALKIESEICFNRASCTNGLSCQPTGTAEGSLCLPALNVGSPCSDTQQCDVGFICDRISGLCSELRQEEEECFGPFDCAKGLYCWDDPLFDTDSCREQGKVGIAESEPCNPVLDRCRLGLFCERENALQDAGICTLLPGLGEPCADFARNLNQECRVGDCALVEGELTCIELRADNASCTTRDQCRSGACVDGGCQPYADFACSVTDAP